MASIRFLGAAGAGAGSLQLVTHAGASQAIAQSRLARDGSRGVIRSPLRRATCPGGSSPTWVRPYLEEAAP